MRHSVDRIPSIAWAAKACARETQAETEILDVNARASRQNKNFHSFVSPWKCSHQWPVHHSSGAGSFCWSHSPQCLPNQEKETQHKLCNPPPPPPRSSSSSSSNRSSNDLPSGKEQRLLQRAPHPESFSAHPPPCLQTSSHRKASAADAAWDQTLVDR